MNILYVTAVPLEYSSSANFRNTALIKGLIENGHSVSTLSTKPQERSECFDKTILNLKLNKRYFVELGALHKGINSAERGSLKSKIKGKLYRVYTAFNLYDSRKNEAGKVSKIDFSSQSFDLIISSSDPKSSHLFAHELIKSNPQIAKRWIQYWGDPFTGDINKRSKVPSFLISKEEKRLISLCDKAVFVSPLTTEYIKNKYPEYKEKIRFVPIGYSQEKIYPEHKSNTLDLCYCGDYNQKDRNLLPLFEAVSELENKCRLTVAGNSDLKPALKENMTVYPRVEKQKVEEIERDSDVIVCVCNRKGTQIPGKIYHASATNRTVLIILDGEHKNEIEKYFKAYGRFAFCENEKNAILKTLKNLSKDKKEEIPCKAFNSLNIAEEILK